ncbi:MAG: VOC family protein [Geminicoccaceae bacterium]
MLQGVAAVRVFTADLHSARQFYGGVLGLSERQHDEDFSVYGLGDQDLVLEFATPDDPEAAALLGRFCGVSIAVDDIDAAYERLRERGVMFEAAPVTEGWGGKLAHFRDRDGNVLTLVQYPARAA